MLACAGVAQAQTLYTYAAAEDGTPGTVAAGVTASNWTRVNGTVSAAACPSGFVSDHWSTAGDPWNASMPAIQVTITPNPGTSATFTSMQFEFRRNNNGPQKMRFAYSTDGGLTWTSGTTNDGYDHTNCFTATTFTWDFADFTTSNAVRFRIYGWDASHTNGDASVRNGSINGTTCTLNTYYADADGDGFGNPGVTTLACSVPVGYSADNTDCDDAHSTVYPGATEICDGLDNNCNGDVDEGVVFATISPEVSAITCKGDPLEFSANDCDGCTYQWFKNDNVIIGATSSTYATTKPAYYSVQVTVPGGCFAVSEHTLLTTVLNPNANIYNPNGLNLCAPTPGNNILIKVGYTATNTYQWYKDGVEYTGEGATSWRIYPSEPGDYYCSITAESGCNRITETRTVINSCRMANDAVSGLSIYPNPATDKFVVSADVDASVAFISVYNATGALISSTQVAVTNGTVNAQINSVHFASGIYMVQVQAGTQVLTQQLVINK
ncbi:MAG: T9SS type A sorting domain-containing protein [Chitinophagales bacterium]